MNYKIETIEGVRVVRFSSPPTIEDIMRAADSLSESQYSIRLWDLSCDIGFSEEQLRFLAEYGKKKFPMSSKVAIIAPADLTFGFQEYTRYTERMQPRS